MAPFFLQAAAAHDQKHPEVEPVYRSLGHGSTRKRSAHLQNRKSALELPPPGGDPYKGPALHLPLAPIVEVEEPSGSGRAGKVHSSKPLSLHMPKYFHVTPLEEKRAKKTTSSKDTPTDHQALQGVASGSELQQEKQDVVAVVDEGPKGGKKRSLMPKLKIGKRTKPVAGATPIAEEVPLIDIGRKDETTSCTAGLTKA